MYNYNFPGRLTCDNDLLTGDPLFAIIQRMIKNDTLLCEEWKPPTEHTVGLYTGRGTEQGSAIKEFVSSETANLITSLVLRNDPNPFMNLFISSTKNVYGYAIYTHLLPSILNELGANPNSFCTVFKKDTVFIKSNNVFQPINVECPYYQNATHICESVPSAGYTIYGNDMTEKADELLESYLIPDPNYKTEYIPEFTLSTLVINKNNIDAFCEFKGYARRDYITPCTEKILPEINYYSSETGTISTGHVFKVGQDTIFIPSTDNIYDSRRIDIVDSVETKKVIGHETIYHKLSFAPGNKITFTDADNALVTVTVFSTEHQNSRDEAILQAGLTNLATTMNKDDTYCIPIYITKEGLCRKPMFLTFDQDFASSNKNIVSLIPQAGLELNEVAMNKTVSSSVYGSIVEYGGQRDNKYPLCYILQNDVTVITPLTICNWIKSLKECMITYHFTLSDELRNLVYVYYNSKMLDRMHYVNVPFGPPVIDSEFGVYTASYNINDGYVSIPVKKTYSITETVTDTSENYLMTDQPIESELCYYSLENGNVVIKPKKLWCRKLAEGTLPTCFTENPQDLKIATYRKLGVVGTGDRVVKIGFDDTSGIYKLKFSNGSYEVYENRANGKEIGSGSVLEALSDVVDTEPITIHNYDDKNFTWYSEEEYIVPVIVRSDGLKIGATVIERKVEVTNESALGETPTSSAINLSELRKSSSEDLNTKVLEGFALKERLGSMSFGFTGVQVSPPQISYAFNITIGDETIPLDLPVISSEEERTKVGIGVADFALQFRQYGYDWSFYVNDNGTVDLNVVDYTAGTNFEFKQLTTLYNLKIVEEAGFTQEDEKQFPITLENDVDITIQGAKLHVNLSVKETIERSNYLDDLFYAFKDASNHPFSGDKFYVQFDIPPSGRGLPELIQQVSNGIKTRESIYSKSDSLVKMYGPAYLPSLIVTNVKQDDTMLSDQLDLITEGYVPMFSKQILENLSIVGYKDNSTKSAPKASEYMKTKYNEAITTLRDAGYNIGPGFALPLGHVTETMAKEIESKLTTVETAVKLGNVDPSLFDPDDLEFINENTWKDLYLKQNPDMIVEKVIPDNVYNAYSIYRAYESSINGSDLNNHVYVYVTKPDACNAEYIVDKNSEGPYEWVELTYRAVLSNKLPTDLQGIF